MKEKKLWIHAWDAFIDRPSAIKYVAGIHLPPQLYDCGGLTLAKEQNLLLIKIELDGEKNEN